MHAGSDPIDKPNNYLFDKHLLKRLVKTNTVPGPLTARFTE